MSVVIFSKKKSVCFYCTDDQNFNVFFFTSHVLKPRVHLGNANGITSKDFTMTTTIKFQEIFFIFSIFPLVTILVSNTLYFLLTQLK